MRIRITHPRFGDDLIAFLNRMGFSVLEVGFDTFSIDSRGDSAAVRAQLQLYLGVWQASRPEVTVAIEDEPAAGDVPARS